MQTMDTNDLVSDLVSDLAGGSFEACGTFSAGSAASPVCSACGWLDREHEPDIADVHALAARRPTPATPKRLAS